MHVGKSFLLNTYLIYILDDECCISAPLISLDYQEVLRKA